MPGLAFAFYSSCVPLFGAPFDSEQMDGWLDFLFLYIPKIQAYSAFDGTLVFNDCMEWVNIPRWGVYRLGWRGQKIRFPFTLVTTQLCPIVAIKRGLAGRDQQRFPYSGLRLKLTFPS